MKDGQCEGGLGQQRDDIARRLPVYERKTGKSEDPLDICKRLSFRWPFLLGSCVLSDRPSALCWLVM